MAHPYLRRFRVDPTQVRVALRPNGRHWTIHIESKVNDYQCTWFAGSAKYVPEALLEALRWAEGAGMPGINVDLMWTYPHPHLTPPEERADRGLS